MTQQEINKFRTKVSEYIDHRRLRDAINEIRDTAKRRMAWEVEDRVKLLEQNYAYMLRYLTDGADDPDRDNVYNVLVNDLYSLLDSLVSYIECAESPTLYYSNLRYLNTHTNTLRLPQLIASYNECADRLSLFAMVMSDVKDNKGNKDTKADQEKAEKLQSEIFMKIWVTPQLSSEDMSALSEILDSGTAKAHLKQHIISAITLGLMQQYDKRRLQLLMSAYMSNEDIKVSSAALVGMLLGLWRYSNRPLTRQLQDQLSAVKETPTWSRDLRIAFIEMIRARDTERINRKMRDELLPKMDKLRPDMMNKINKANTDGVDPMTMQENPEWQEMLDKAGITDQLKELTELQMEGGDVLMSTFAHLKQYPFFQNISNWFLPFEPEHSSVSETVRELDIIGDMMENARFMCDSDKYSFLFIVGTVPPAQREMLLSQMKAQSEGLYEAMSCISNVDGAEGRRLAVNSYMQNIYRFYKLYPRKNEFFDPFDKGINLISVPSLSEDFGDIDMLQIVAEFYFKLQYMQEALEVYNHLERLTPGDAARYQKIGYCHERLQDYESATKAYQRAELLDSSSSWTLRRLAASYRALGDKAAALLCYKRMATMQPDDLSAAMLYGQSLLENGDYTEALHELYKVEFMDEKNTRVWRPLAWTLFMTGSLAEAKGYYMKILMDCPTADDYLNMGHVELASGNIRDAVNDYALAIQQRQGDREWFVKALQADAEALSRAGVDLNILPLIADATIYSILSETNKQS